jgi:hypothetical protein
VIEAARARHVDAAMDRMNPGRTGIRHHDSGRPQDRQPADDAEPAVDRAGCERLAAGNGDLDLDIARRFAGCGHFGNRGTDHSPRHRIDGRFTGRQGQTRTRHGADAFAGTESNACSRRAGPYRCKNQGTVRHVRVVARVFDDAGRRRIFISALRGEREGRPLTARQSDLDRIGELAGDQRRIGRLGGRGRAGAGGPPSAQRPRGHRAQRFLFVSGHALAPSVPQDTPPWL